MRFVKLHDESESKESNCVHIESSTVASTEACAQRACSLGCVVFNWKGNTHICHIKSCSKISDLHLIVSAGYDVYIQFPIS